MSYILSDFSIGALSLIHYSGLFVTPVSTFEETPIDEKRWVLQLLAYESFTISSDQDQWLQVG